MKRLINLIVFIVILGGSSFYYFDFRNNLNREIEDIQYNFNKKDKYELMKQNRKVKYLQGESNSLEVKKSFLESKNYQIKDEIMVIKSKIENYRRYFAGRLDDDLRLKRKDVENKIQDSRSKINIIENKLKNEENELKSEASSLKSQLNSALSRFDYMLSNQDRRCPGRIINNTNDKKIIIAEKNRLVNNVNKRINYINRLIYNINSEIENLEEIEGSEKFKVIKDLKNEMAQEEKNRCNLIDTLSGMTIESILNEEPDLKQYNQRLETLTKEVSEKTLELELTCKKLGKSYIACDFAQAERNDLTEGKTRKLEKLTDKQTQLQQKVGSIYAIGMIIGILLFLICDRRFAQNYDL
ncbi:MAG: hypothetical protein RSD12_07010 [Akkermansia sp.]